MVNVKIYMILYTLQELQMILTNAAITKNSDWSSYWWSMGKDGGAKSGTFVSKIILQKYTSLWIDLTDILVFTAYLEMS